MFPARYCGEAINTRPSTFTLNCFMDETVRRPTFKLEGSMEQRMIDQRISLFMIRAIVAVFLFTVIIAGSLMFFLFNVFL